MKAGSPRPAPPLAREILEYLRGNPRASDTPEGIVQWWLGKPRHPRTLIETRAALAELVERGLIMARRGSDGRTHYRLTPGKAGSRRKVSGSG